MKRLFAAALTAMLLASPVQAQKMYAGGQLGTSVVTDSDIDDGTGIAQSVSFNPGVSLVGFFGYEVIPNFRVEAEAGYAFNSVDTIPEQSSELRGSSDAAMARKLSASSA